MHTLIGENGKVGYGCLDGPVRFNHEAFPLRTFFGRKAGALRRRMALGAFSYLGILGDGFVAGLAAVRLGYVANVFGFFFDSGTGAYWERSVKDRPGRLVFPLDPDACAIHYESRGCGLDLAKSHDRERLEVEARFGERLVVKGLFPYGFRHHPLRVVNPSCGDPNRFTFTEKCAPLLPEALSVTFDGVERAGDLGRVAAVYDWSAGFFNRNSNWLWSALAGVLPDGTPVGANFAALVNESFYPENAFWVGGKRIRLAQVVFDYDPEDPRREDWRIFTEDGQVELRFRPLGERGERTRLPFLKVNFRQFFGEYTGWLRDPGGRSVRLERLMGVAEIHLSVW
ncbi:DUF2804 domain-containing protein [Mesoterricola silvestris]|uniref:DUF2804 domain-containing protein n=1 Tax=Mesoterricola silvestris TaxID=2927979 RepID=A0AA48KA91_9BACT|nr:DUF2804 domain-containing protein [Mesoterricola silvestris]BDU71288.1 hypothetical protein METEAL_04620 [Mesoterricola silvestris]